MKKNKIVIGSIATACIALAVIFFILPNNKITETVKRNTAKLLVYEYIPNQSINVETTLAAQQRDSIYQDFRQKYRFHYQTIGVANLPDSSHIVLLSEPAPFFSTDSINSIFSKFAHSVTIKKHRIGFDGFVTDIIISVGNATEENMHNLINHLSKVLFLSDYKPAVLMLPTAENKKYFTKNNLDYQITLYEFNDWFLENDEAFIDLKDTGKKITVENMFSDKMRGVFFSKLPGFVAWSIAKKSDLKEQVNHIRQFTLDADLILGALSDSTTLVIIGREREAALNELPPLQIETILLLASITEKELSQSLDINDFLAGKMNNGRDWCPTYLSKELENTEFGDLLTMTDVLLKDWSERGTIEELFYRYPKPGRYPFDKPLFKKLGLNELVYNWNTANAMYAIDMDAITIYTLNRTGSLPVSYFNSQERSVSIGSRYENQAYQYFATLGNTDLARVVQYTALYQLFIDNKITYSGNTYSAFPKNKPFLLNKPTKSLLTFFKNIKDYEIDYLCDSLAARSFARYQKEHIDNQINKNEHQYGFKYNTEQIEKIYNDVGKDTRSDFREDFVRCRNMLSSLSEEQFDKLSRYLAYPRGCPVNNQSSYTIMLKARQVNQLIKKIGKNNLDLIKLDLSSVKNYFVNNLKNSSAKYMKTSSIIVTYNDLLTTGGHNLNSKISRVHSLTNYKQSTPTTVVHNSQPTSSPTHTSGAKTGSVKPQVKAQPPVSRQPTTRPRSSVISSAPRTQRGF